VCYISNYLDLWHIATAFTLGVKPRVTLPAFSVESDFLQMLLFESAPNRVRDLFQNPTESKIEQLCMLFVFTLAVGFGYSTVFSYGRS
jgi:hypothetical protein